MEWNHGTLFEEGHFTQMLSASSSFNTSDTLTKLNRYSLRVHQFFCSSSRVLLVGIRFWFWIVSIERKLSHIECDKPFALLMNNKNEINEKKKIQFWWNRSQIEPGNGFQLQIARLWKNLTEKGTRRASSHMRIIIDR